jgi:hypothetical protein
MEATEMTKKFPKKLFVKVEQATPEDYFVAEEGIEGMCMVGERVKVAIYELVQVDTLEGLVKVIPPAKRKR